MSARRRLSRVHVYDIEVLVLPQNQWLVVYEDIDKDEGLRLVIKDPPEFGQFRLVERITTSYVIANRPEEDEPDSIH